RLWSYLLTSPVERESVEEKIARLKNFEEVETDRKQQDSARNLRERLQGAMRLYMTPGGADYAVLLTSTLCMSLLDEVLQWQGAIVLSKAQWKALGKDSALAKHANKLKPMVGLRYPNLEELLKAVAEHLAQVDNPSDPTVTAVKQLLERDGPAAGQNLQKFQD